MTIEGVVSSLNGLMKAEDVPIYYKPAIKTIIDTIIIEWSNKWIPVSERLPEKNVWVLVTVVQGSGWYVETMRIDKYKGMFTDNIDYYDSVIAWMPLPEPYKGE